MADRKQFMGVVNADPKLLEKLAEGKGRLISEEELREQRISFAYGNAPAKSELITKDSVRHTSENVRLLT